MRMHDTLWLARAPTGVNDEQRKVGLHRTSTLVRILFCHSEQKLLRGSKPVIACPAIYDD